MLRAPFARPPRSELPWPDIPWGGNTLCLVPPHEQIQCPSICGSIVKHTSFHRFNTSFSVVKASWLPEQFPLFVAGTLALWRERAVCAENVSSAQLSLINHGWWILVDTGGMFQPYESYDANIFTHRYMMMTPIDFLYFLYLQTGFSTTWSSGGNFQPDFPSESSDDRGSFAQGRGLESFTPDLQEISRSGWTGGTGRSSGWVDRGRPGWPGRKCFAANQEPPETAAKSPLWFRGVRGVVCGEWDSRW